jgi:endonuclease YncB( thermonuclease family)
MSSFDKFSSPPGLSTDRLAVLRHNAVVGFIASKQFAAGFASMALLAGGAVVVGSNAASGEASNSFQCSVASVTDGDTLRCSEVDASGRGIRVRLSGIAARERDGTCAPGHPCATASAESATAALERLADGQTLRCQAVGSTFGRTAAFCRNEAGQDLSCAMIASGTVVKWDRYWGNHRC